MDKWYVIVTKNQDVYVVHWDGEAEQMLYDLDRVHGREKWRLLYFSEDETYAKARAYDYMDAYRVMKTFSPLIRVVEDTQNPNTDPPAETEE